MTTAAIIVAAGKGIRAGGALPKQYQTLGGTALVAHAVDCFAAHADISHIIIIHAAQHIELLHVALGNRTVAAMVSGGILRQDSVRIGLNTAKALGASQVLIHDAARPFIPAEVIDRLLEALRSSVAAIPTLPVADTLVRGDRRFEAVVPRDGLNRVQTPQAFHIDAILAAHEHWGPREATDDAQVAATAGHGVALVPGDVRLDKVTLAQDFARMEAMMQSPMNSRTGMGYDVHRLEAGEELWLGGVKIPHTHGLSGHSDADVALHALVDAILGAIADGDIGVHFPPSDPQWLGADSSQFLEYARDRVQARGGIIDHVDLTLICEAPKIGPFRDAMRARIAELLRLNVNSVSIKATTTERLGFAGRSEGIAAQAVATVRLPQDVK
jgi:2-C-methyl-D-erythritol 4-phosphate cytidylyltransferase / 2-C-methyl-D-erythritol 2,4-cyclodiphosphate synthase